MSSEFDYSFAPDVAHRPRRCEVAFCAVQVPIFPKGGFAALKQKKVQILHEPNLVKLTCYQTCLQQGTNFGSEQKETVAMKVIERLLTKPVAGQEQCPSARVPNGEGEHASEIV